MTRKRTLYIFGGALVLTALLVAVVLNVYAATTFDSDIVPDTSGVYGLGALQGDWDSINATIFFDSYYVGISSASFTPTSRLHVRGDVRVENGDVYIDTYGKGVIVKSPDTACWRLTVDNSGVVGAATTTCP